MRPLPRRRNRTHSSPERSRRLGSHVLRSLVIAALGVALAGCGGASSEPSLAEAAERTEAQGTGRFEAHGDLKDADGSIPVACEGEADYSAKRVRIDCEYGRLGGLEVIAIGSDSYVRGPLYGAGTDKWSKSTGEVDDDDALQSLSPEKLLRLLRDASSETERLGEEEIRGVETVGYRLTVDCDVALLSCESTAPVDVWIGDDGIVRRIELEDDDGNVTFEFFDFGAEVTIEPPPEDEVVDEFSLGSGSSSSESGSCSGEASPVSVERAQAALRRHGFDVERDAPGCLRGVAGTLATDVAEQDSPWLTCHVLDAASGVAIIVDAQSLGGRRERTDREFENLRCVLFVEQGDDDAVRRLDAAFAELRR